MPKRILDGDALWASSKLALCPEWTIPEYAWLYPLADGNGSFEITNLRVIHGKISGIRPHFFEENLRDVIREFNRHGLLFIWSENGKTYAHWTGSDRPGRLPKQSERKRYQIFAPEVPKPLLNEYLQNIAITSRVNRDLIATGVGVGVGLGVGVGSRLEGQATESGDADRPAPPEEKKREEKPLVEEWEKPEEEPLNAGTKDLLENLGISLPLWKDFRNMRERIHRPVVTGAEDLILSELLGLREEKGENPIAVIEQAIKTASFMLYPVRKESGKNGHELFEDKRSRENAKDIASVLGLGPSGMVGEVHRTLRKENLADQRRSLPGRIERSERGGVRRGVPSRDTTLRILPSSGDDPECAARSPDARNAIDVAPVSGSETGGSGAHSGDAEDHGRPQSEAGDRGVREKS